MSRKFGDLIYLEFHIITNKNDTDSDQAVAETN